MLACLRLVAVHEPIASSLPLNLNLDLSNRDSRASFRVPEAGSDRLCRWWG